MRFESLLDAMWLQMMWLLTAGNNVKKCRYFDCDKVINLSCPLQTLNGVGQQETDDLQLETSGRHRVDPPGKHRAQVSENRLYVLASGLAQELFPCSHRPLGSLLALGFEMQADLF